MSDQAPTSQNHRTCDGTFVPGCAVFVTKCSCMRAVGKPDLQAANLLRKSHGIRVTGGQAPAPLVNFDDLSSRYKCSKRLMAELEEHGWHEPTAIQRQAIPILLEGRELFAVAPTGQSLLSLQLSRSCRLLEHTTSTDKIEVHISMKSA